jgi:hypothetical protein
MNELLLVGMQLPENIYGEFRKAGERGGQGGGGKIPGPRSAQRGPEISVNVRIVYHRLACEQALKLNWEPASMTNEFEYLRLKSWSREILIGQML